jgi:hypothetical protein
MQVKWEDLKLHGISREEFLEVSGGGETASHEALINYCKYKREKIRRVADSLGIEPRR